jgi:glycine/D-amino acid oxidase-like deaminating enzyme
MNIKNTYDVIVIGAGVIGCSIAYHLTKAGFKTGLFDQGQVGAGASGANFGMVQSDDAELFKSIPMVQASYARFDNLEAELGMPFGFRRIASLHLLSTEKQWKDSEERANVLSRAGIPYEFVSPARIRKIEPMVDPGSLFGGWYCSSQAQCNPLKLLWAYLRPAIQSGLSVHTYTQITGFEVKSGRVCGIKTNNGDFSAGMVVLATAAWTRQLGMMIGQDWKIHVFRASAMVTEPVPNLKLNTIISTADHMEMEVTGKGDSELTILGLTQTADGHFMIAQADRPGDAVNSIISHAAPKTMAIMVGRFFPVLRKARLLRAWTSPTTFTDDGCPLLGPVKNLDGLILAASYRSALVHSPLAGEIVTQLISTGRSDLFDIREFAPERSMEKVETFYIVKSTETTPQNN